MYSISYFDFMISRAAFVLMTVAQIFTIILSIKFYCKDFAHSVPTNYIFVGISTIFITYSLTYLCADSAFMAVIITLCITVGLTLYAMTAKLDFTFMRGTLFLHGKMAFFFMGIFLIIHEFYWEIGICAFGLFFYLLFDTQFVMGNKNRKLSVDDYIIGALLLYTDILMIFLYVLEILQNLQRTY